MTNEPLLTTTDLAHRGQTTEQAVHATRHRGDCPKAIGHGKRLLWRIEDIPATYDFVGAVVWNARAPTLWARTTAVVNRAMAGLLGVSQRAWATVGRASVAKVAEYQTRERCDGDGVRENLDHLQVNPHAKAMIRACWQLGGLDELQHLRIRAWAHMFGLRGHFSTKTRRYSTTLGCLRDAQRNWRNNHALRAHGLDETTAVHRCNSEDLADLKDQGDDTVLVVGDWIFAGRGRSGGQVIYAQTIAQDIWDNRCVARDALREDESWGASG